jgi:hypothetical protein
VHGAPQVCSQFTNLLALHCDAGTVPSNWGSAGQTYLEVL